MATTLKDKEIKRIAEKTLSNYELCDHCLGRLFAKIQSGTTNQRRGEQLRDYIKLKKKIDPTNCWLCEGLIDEIPHFAELVIDALDDYEYDTFLLGCKVDEDILEREQELIGFTKSDYSESIKNEINRETGKILENKLEKEVNFLDPAIMVVIDTAFDVVELQIKSLYVYGRYKKYYRDIPQTRWFCRICKGRGCKKCDYKGQIYETSVEELIAKEFLLKTKGDDESFHGCGREDVDVRMLGNGRPFVLEIKNPKNRSLNLSEMESKINKKNNEKVNVSNLRFSNKEEILRIKNAIFRKKYRVMIKGEKPINNEKLKKAAQSLPGSKISQFTPSRVAHRRANMVREKQIYNCDIESLDGAIAILTLETESGTYIKELISGDNGKTKPNISDIIGVPCKVLELDVIEIKGE